MPPPQGNKPLFDGAINHHHPLKITQFNQWVPGPAPRPAAWGEVHQGGIYIQLRFQSVFLLICFTLEVFKLEYVLSFFFVFHVFRQLLPNVHFFPLDACGSSIIVWKFHETRELMESHRDHRDQVLLLRYLTKHHTHTHTILMRDNPGWIYHNVWSLNWMISSNFRTRI